MATVATTARRRKPPLSVRTSRPGASGGPPPPPPAEPLSPSARLYQNFYIVTLLGCGTPINHAAARAGLTDTLVRHPRFSSIQVTDGFDDGKPRWVRTTVNLDDHIIVPSLDPDAVAANPDQVVEDYVASLSTLPMDFSRPLWELHFMDFPSSEAAATVAFRVHHSLGDGTSLLSLLFACAQSAASPKALPAMPRPTRRTGPIYARPRPAWSAGVLAFAMWVWSYGVLAWNTVVDVAAFLATILFLRDPHTLFKRANHGEVPGKRLVHRSLSLEDVKFVKSAMNCTVNDVLVGVTSAALSRYYFRKSGDTNTKKNICFRSILLVNIRSTPGLHALADMMDHSKDTDAKWGNRLGYIILPFHIAMHDDPLEYVRKAKKTMDRKKCSLEVIFTHAVAETIIETLGVKVAGAVFQRMVTHTTISFSNLMGPVEKVELFGHPIVFIAPSTYGPPEALTVNFQSYMNTVKVILAVDDAQFPDSHELLDDFAESLRIIRGVASTA